MIGKPNTTAELMLRHEVERLTAALAAYQADYRDRAALAALPSLLSRHRADVAWANVAPLAYEIADAMLAARGGSETEQEA